MNTINNTWENLICPIEEDRSCMNCVHCELSSDNKICRVCLDNDFSCHVLINWKWNGSRD